MQPASVTVADAAPLLARNLMVSTAWGGRRRAPAALAPPPLRAARARALQIPPATAAALCQASNTTANTSTVAVETPLRFREGELISAAFMSSLGLGGAGAGLSAAALRVVVLTAMGDRLVAQMRSSPVMADVISALRNCTGLAVRFNVTVALINAGVNTSGTGGGGGGSSGDGLALGLGLGLGVGAAVAIFAAAVTVSRCKQPAAEPA